MIPPNALQTLRDREVEIRRRSEDERRRRAELDRHGDPYGMDAEIRVLIERSHEPACCDCEAELTREAG
ncbi:MAG TPA: hypothetical protein VFM40_08185 [Actinomycetota bacterium]|nr:hypothetical protein [Actinomycetota bacterium]